MHAYLTQYQLIVDHCSGDDAGEDLVMLPEVKRKLEEVQVMNLKLTDEVEKLETMLKLQSSINKDLHQVWCGYFQSDIFGSSCVWFHDILNSILA